MCSYIDMDTHPEWGYVAEKDIRCYKVLVWRSSESAWASPYFHDRHRRWRPNERETSDLNLLPDTVYESCFMAGCGEWYRVRDTEFGPDWEGEVHPVNLRMTSRGFYSFTNYMNGDMAEFVESLMASAWRERALGLFRCFVPAGTRYYVDEDAGVIVSSSLVLDGLAGIVSSDTYDPDTGKCEVLPPCLETTFCKQI